MDRDKFKEEMKKTNVPIPDGLRTSIMARHRSNVTQQEIYIVAMEELSELQKEISKTLRGIGERDGLLEEIADVIIVVDNIRHLQNIGDLELDRALTVKLERLLDKTVKKEASDEANCKMCADCPHRGIGCGSCGNSSSYGEVYHQGGEDTFSKPD